jgi:hypothetical protein
MDSQEVIKFINEVKNHLLQEGKLNQSFKILEGKLEVKDGGITFNDDNHPTISFGVNDVIYPSNLQSSQVPVLLAVEDTFKKTVSDLVIKTLGHPTNMFEVQQRLNIPELEREEQPRFFF